MTRGHGTDVSGLHPPVAQRRFPLGPLLVASGALHATQFQESARADGRYENREDAPRVMPALAEATGVSVGQLHRWKREGIPLRSADRAAVAIGHHPGEIWEEWWEV